MSQLKQLAGQTVIYGIPTIVGRVLGFLLIPLYTRVLIKELFGIVTELQADVALMLVLLTYGMETAFFRFSEKHDNKREVYSTVFLSILITSLLFIVLCAIFLPDISGALGYAAHQNYILVLVITLAIDALRSIVFARLRELHRAFRFAAIKSTEIILMIGFNLFFLLACPYLLKHSNGMLYDFIAAIYNPNDQVFYIFLSNLLANIVTLVLMLPEILSVQLKINIKLWKSMILYGLPVMVWGLAGLTNEVFDRTIMKYLIPANENPMAQLGIYGACYKVSIIMSLFIQAFRFAAEPFFFQKAKQSDSRQVYADVMKYFVIVCSFIFLATMLYIDIAMLFVGEEFRVGAGVVPILLMANMFLGIYYNLSIWYKLTDRTIWGAFISSIGAAITLILNFLLIPEMGYMGAAWATFICYLTIMTISYFLGQHKYRIPYNTKRIVFYILAVTAVFLLSTLFKFDNKVIHYTINTFLLIGFVLMAYLLDFKGKKIL